MKTQIYVNLPVKDLERSKAFFARLGFSFNAQFTDEKAACMVVSDDIYVMLLVESFFQTFTKKPVADANKTTEVLICLSAENREKVDDYVEKAVAAGGKVSREPQDLGFMYSQAFEDPDGHIWELVTMDESAMAQS